MNYRRVEDGEVWTPEKLRKRGFKLERNAHIRMRVTGEFQEDDLRAALGYLVEAFLLDREGQADLFAHAHRIGLVLSRHGCDLEFDPSTSEYTLRCPILALHEPWGYSISVTTLTECSICGAGAFECSHVEGENYDGDTCFMQISKMVGMDHVAITANPDFISTWYQPTRVSGNDAINRYGARAIGDTLSCTHCEDCPGTKLGAQPDDIDKVGALQRLIGERKPPKEA